MKFIPTTTIACLTLLFFAQLGTTTYAKETKWEIDASHSSVIYRIKHKEVSFSYGVFFSPEGYFNWDEVNPEKSSVQITINLLALESGVASRDEHILGPKYFDAEEFFEATFKSTKVKKIKKNVFAVTGIMTMHGVNVEITANVEKTGEKKSKKGTIAGFETIFTLDRTQFKIGPDTTQGLSAEVKIMGGFEAKLAKPKKAKQNASVKK